ncbi:MAG: carboxypeptidase-like regulatory domain-containing protein, partial [Melioribacteraceae bacterium]|nr:carboxypeptidase-like regulatory domain-containing protein [Melioribacteraceae bacterium]
MSISNYKKTGLFFGLSTIIPWTFWFLAGYISHAEPSSKLITGISSLISFLGLLAPLVITIVLSWNNKLVKDDLLKRFCNFKEIKLKYLFITSFLMLISILLAQAISLLFGYTPNQFQFAETFSFSSGVFPVWFMLIIAPLLEELAWHSYGTDSLRTKFNLFNTSIIFALFWGIWHFPLSFIKDYYHSNLVNEGLIYSLNFIFSLIPFVIIMNWIYYKTGRNIFLPIIFHITAGYFNEIFATHPMSKVIQTGLLLFFSTYIILKDKEFFFNKDFLDKRSNQLVPNNRKPGIITAIIIVSLFTIVLPVQTDAQEVTQNILGKVSDNTTHEPLPFANIIVLDSDPLVAGATDIDGNFLLRNVKVGRQTIKISMIGYNTYLIKELLVNSGQEMNLEIGMQRSDIELDEVIVSVSKATPLNSMATVSGRQFTVEETQRYAGGMDDPGRLASSFAGVSNPSLTSNGISVRGNNPDGLLWQIEGVEVPNPNHFANLTIAGGGVLSALSSQLIGNSDFYTGAFPAEYGNASSGVFDIRLREGNHNKQQYAFEAGLLGVGAMAQGPFSQNSDATYIANYRYSTMALLSPILPSDAGVLKYQDLSFKFNIPTKKLGVFSLWGIGAIDGQKMAATDSADWESQFDRDNSETKLYMFATALSHKIILPGAAFLNTTISATGNSLRFTEDRLDYNLNANPQSKAENNSTRFTFQSELTKRFSDVHSNKTGLKYSTLNFDIDVEQSLAEGELPTEIAFNSGNTGFIQFFSQSKINLFPNLVLNAGINSQYLLLNDNFSIEPRLGLKFNINNDHSLGFAYGVHSRLEQLPVYFVSNNGRRPNKDLEFMKSTHYVLSYNASISENLHLSIEPY